jgi:hypothetical protein
MTIKQNNDATSVTDTSTKEQPAVKHDVKKSFTSIGYNNVPHRTATTGT